ncbi:NADase-type glycan-binding domain-containing protein, partial [Amycolatopsis magusensis]|uniref:NADase-type glycan-binding domain-containing protein n=1 Tax=Amycolatopsis magusensis TaxID=882444 RepID=UPI0024A99A8F
AVAAPEAPPRPDPELVAALAAPVSGTAYNRLDEEPPELRPAPAIKKTRAVVRTKPSRRLEPGDLVCATCGEGNAPTRNFCSRCGEDLADAGVVREKWWRKLFRRRKQHAAGTRPGQKGTGEHRRWLATLSFRRLKAIALVLAVLVTLAFAVYPPLRATVRDNAVALYRKVVPRLEPVRPITATSAHGLPEHESVKAWDTYNNTYWAAPMSGGPPKITFTFGDSFLMRNIILHAGAEGSFVANGRPSILKLTYNTGRTENVLPSDTSRQQTLELKNTTLVTSITVEVIDVYRGSDNPTVAISELEFFALK